RSHPAAAGDSRRRRHLVPRRGKSIAVAATPHRLDPEELRRAAAWVGGAVVMACLAALAIQYGPARPGNGTGALPTGTWDGAAGIALERGALADPGMEAITADLAAEIEALSIRSEALFAENAALRDRLASLEATLAALAPPGTTI